jgi:hypothetical protein
LVFELQYLGSNRGISLRNALALLLALTILSISQPSLAGECIIAWNAEWSKTEALTLQDCEKQVAVIAKSLCEDFSETMGATDLSYTFSGQKYSAGHTSFSCQ